LTPGGGAGKKREIRACPERGKEGRRHGRREYPAWREARVKSERESSAGIKSALKTLRVLTLFSAGKNVWSVHEMMAALGYHKSSVQRIVSTLEAEGFLSRVSAGKGVYRLGPMILFLGNLAEMSTDLRSIVQPAMVLLVEAVQETSYLCVVDGHQCLYVEKVECSQPIRIIHAIGKRNPLHCTGLGKVLLSGMAPDEIERVIAEGGLKGYTPNTITDRRRLLQELEAIRERGLAYDSEELDLGVSCMAAPIYDRKGKIAASLGVSGPTQRFTPEKVALVEIELRVAAGAISSELGFRPKGSAAWTMESEAR
jgi:IclR family KDG regulon transcriptional repressor